MSAFYDELVELATELVEEFGRPMELITTTTPGTGYDPRPVSSDPVPIIGVQLEFDSREIDGNLIQQNDRLIIMDSSVPPDMGGRIQDPGDSTTAASIVRVIAERPGPTTIYYAAHVRS